ncbi:MAG: N-acetylglucosamine-6-phosphate deacetylase [Devosia sp.]
MSTSPLIAFVGARIFDGNDWHESALLVRDGKVERIGPPPDDCRLVHVPGGCIAPGYVDLQVNGGGGHLVGARTDVEQLRAICATHARFGVTALLPTLITSSTAVLEQVLDAGIAASRQGVPGFLGLHIEGPHLSVARKGAHDPGHIRPMGEDDVVRLERARQVLPHLLVTVAPESVTPEQIARLVRAGVVVSLGHTDASFDVALTAFRAGASMATHLFNAMSQIGNRDPGVAGAALHYGAVSAGLIADGIHVHPETVRIALTAKAGPGRIFLVSDSMSQAGTDIETLTLDERTIYRRDGALRLADGKLAGADLTLDRAVSNAHRMVGLDTGRALAMATSDPAAALGAADQGSLRPGRPASFVLLDDDLRVRQTWLAGSPVEAASIRQKDLHVNVHAEC